MRALPVVLFAFTLAATARAQCATTWLPGSGVPGTDTDVAVSTMWDPDGAGPAAPLLVVGGGFTVAGQVAADRVATWDPATETFAPLGVPIGAGVAGSATALLARANGELLAAFGTQAVVQSHRVMRWTGTAWQQVGADFDVAPSALLELPNGDVVAGGGFTTIGGAPVARLARWNGSAWSHVGGGVDGPVRCLSLAPNGDLIVGGTFWNVGGGSTPASSIARWDGTAWHAFGSGIAPIGSDGVYAMAWLPSGDLVAGGVFPNAGGGPVGNVARWNGSGWSAMGGGFNTWQFPFGSVRSLLCLPNGELVAGGMFTQASGGTARCIARWNGTVWQPIGGGFQGLSMFTNATVATLTLLPSGELLAGGTFKSGGAQLGDGVSRWNGTAWRQLAAGFNNTVVCLAAGRGGELVAGGTFTVAGTSLVNRIARWDGAQWVAMGSGASAQVNAVAVLDDGSIVAGGAFTSIGGVAASRVARWNGTSWSPLGSGVSGTVNAIAEMPNGDLVVAGSFLTAGGVTCNRVARWNGAAWADLGGGLGGNASVLHVRPDGSLVAGGIFSTAGTTNVNNVAVWDGATWSALGWLINPTAFATAATGELLAASGSSVVRWTGSAWTGVGSAPDNWVYDLAVLPDGAIVATGDFGSIGGVAAQRIARWNGSAWAPIGAGLQGRGLALAWRPSGELVVGGMFTFAGGQPSPYLARLTTPCAASSALLGAGCGSSGGANALALRELPWVGGTMRARSEGVPTLALVVAVTGFAPVSLPLASVFPSGVSGCKVHVSPDLLDVVLAAGNTADVALAIPPTPALVGQSFHHQHVPIEFDATGAFVAITATNAVTLTIGSF